MFGFSSALYLSRYGLEKRLRERFARAWRAHDPLHAAPAHLFEDHAGYQWRVYTLAPEALRDFEARFDYHTQQQEAAHLQRLAESHFHSKAKTKHLRHALALHLCEESRLGHAVNEWNTVVPLPAMLVGRALSDYMDKCDRTVADFVADVLQRGDAAPKPSVGGGGRATVRQQLLAVLATNQGHLEQLQPPRIHPVLEIMRAVLRARHPWIESGNVLKVASCKNALRTFGSPEQLQLYCLAAKALYFAGFWLCRHGYQFPRYTSDLVQEASIGGGQCQLRHLSEYLDCPWPWSWRVCRCELGCGAPQHGSGCGHAAST